MSNNYPHEQFTVQQDTLAELQAGRELLAQRMAEADMRRVFNPQQVTEHWFAVGRTTINGGLFDEGKLRAETLLGLSAVGIDPMAVVEGTRDSSGEGGLITGVATPDGALDILQYGRGVSLRIRSTDESKSDRKSGHLQHLAGQRLLRSPAHQALMEAGKKLGTDSDVPYEVSTEPFDIMEDPLGSLVFLSDVGLEDYSDDLRIGLLDGYDLKSILEHRLENSGYGTTSRKSTDGMLTVTWGKQPHRTLAIDPEGMATFSAKQQPIMHYLEQANQSVESYSLPFIESECARELSEVLDTHGLMFHPDVQRTMMQPGEADRYGSIYTDLSREIAKWVDNPSRVNISNLFVPYDAAYSASALAGVDRYLAPQYPELTEEAEAMVRQSLQAATLPSGEAAATILQMVQDVLARPEGQSHNSDLPVTAGRVDIRNGACFDVVSYYVGAATQLQWTDSRLKRESVGDVALLAKTHGSATHMTQHETMFNGVRLPKGALMKRYEDDTWAFLRLTPFAFDEPVDQLAFGSEITKALKTQAEEVKNLGELTLQNLAKAAR